MMQELTATAADLKELYHIISGPVRAGLLLAGIELEVFNHLETPLPARDVADMLNTHPENTRLFLDGLVAAGLLEKNNGRYQTSETTRAVLVKGKSGYMGELLTMMSQDLPLERLLDLIRQGPAGCPDNQEMGSEDTWLRYAECMANYQRAGLARQAVDIVSNLPGFHSFERMLDLGGGPGIVCLALAGAHPTMSGVIFDKPAVTQIARTFIETYRMAGRVSVKGGDFMTDPIGQDYDLVWASATLNFAGPSLDIPVKKVFQALKPGGVFVSLADGLTRERTQPEQMVLSNLSHALMGQDIGIDQGRIAQAMERAGFARLISRTVDSSMMPMDLDIAWKAL